MSDETKTQHTPGPWIVSEVESGWAIDSDGVRYVADVHKHVEPDADNAQDEANACLIAAAPDLLAALKVGADSICRADCDRVEDLHGPVCEKARAAIAKAIR